MGRTLSLVIGGIVVGLLLVWLVMKSVPANDQLQPASRPNQGYTGPRPVEGDPSRR